ncbi:abortive infection family protein [Rubellimicrobium roseum]|uniref:Abortive infection protein-like C-terminal domain-containing protein n=1 Tax=Rubellimicrobium roseum TaxID=687525 RepID=A0A5C4N8P6_9RHOB|nr:abortive infection family protein [Rubellimicrobium roseum]TNC61571.1 hypothetical protein FHG71_21040 [Rubellimicrobium roseum]
MPFVFQMLRALIENHPDRAERLRTHVDALEVTINDEPSRCLERVRALFEATQLTIAPQLGVTLKDAGDLAARNKQLLEALDFKLAGHPEAERIDRSIKKLIGSINGTIGALGELSNVPGLRHGGSLDWAMLEGRHAVMLGGLCDTLIAFLFDAAWSRPVTTAADSDPDLYPDYAAFNGYLDDEHEVVVAGSTLSASRALYLLDRTQYDMARVEWEAEQMLDQDNEDEAA